MKLCGTRAGSRSCAASLAVLFGLGLHAGSSWADVVTIPRIEPQLPAELQPDHCRVLLGAAGRRARGLAKIAPFSVEQTPGFAEMPAVVNNAYLVCRALQSPAFEDALIAGVKKNVASQMNKWTAQYVRSADPNRPLIEHQDAFLERLRLDKVVEWADQKPGASGKTQNVRRLGFQIDFDALAKQIDSPSFIARASQNAAQWAAKSNIPFDRVSFERDLVQALDGTGEQLARTLVTKPSFRRNLQALFHGNAQNHAVSQLLLAADADVRKTTARDRRFRALNEVQGIGNAILSFRLGPRNREHVKTKDYEVEVRDDGTAQVRVSYPGEHWFPKKIEPRYIEHVFALPKAGAADATPKRVTSTLKYGVPLTARGKSATGFAYDPSVFQDFGENGSTKLCFSLGREGGEDVTFDYALTGKPGRPRVKLVDFRVYPKEPIESSDGRKTEMVRFLPRREKGKRGFVGLTYPAWVGAPHGAFEYSVPKTKAGPRTALAPSRGKAPTPTRPPR